MTETIQIRDPEVVRDIRLLAALLNQSIEEAIGDAVRAKLSVVEGACEAAVVGIRAESATFPIIGEPLTNADVYDEDWLPRR